MIDKATIDRIQDTAQIVEVVWRGGNGCSFYYETRTTSILRSTEISC